MLRGDTANKIGTYSLAVLCRHHGVPFYVAAPLTTLDATLPKDLAGSSNGYGQWLVDRQFLICTMPTPSVTSRLVKIFIGSLSFSKFSTAMWNANTLMDLLHQVKMKHGSEIPIEVRGAKHLSNLSLDGWNASVLVL